jgi:hypothetical protein
MRTTTAGSPRLAWALILALAGCAGDKPPAPAPGTGKDALTTRVLSTTGTMPAFDELALRIDNEDDKSALMLKALAHGALQARGIRAAALAPLTLTLTVRRPRRTTTGPRTSVGISGRGGSSSKDGFGLSITLPVFGDEDEARAEPHIMDARLEHTRPDGILWRAEARIGAVASDTIDAAAARRLVDALIEKLSAARR